MKIHRRLTRARFFAPFLALADRWRRKNSPRSESVLTIQRSTDAPDCELRTLESDFARLGTRENLRAFPLTNNDVSTSPPAPWTPTKRVSTFMRSSSSRCYRFVLHFHPALFSPPPFVLPIKSRSFAILCHPHQPHTPSLHILIV